MWRIKYGGLTLEDVLIMAYMNVLEALEKLKTDNSATVLMNDALVQRPAGLSRSSWSTVPVM
jgi:hypothetical protein